MGIFRFTKDVDFLVYEDSKAGVHEIMTGLGYEKQDFSTDEIISYVSPRRYSDRLTSSWQGENIRRP
jgi:hypothetical protein